MTTQTSDRTNPRSAPKSEDKTRKKKFGRPPGRRRAGAYEAGESNISTKAAWNARSSREPPQAP